MTMMMIIIIMIMTMIMIDAGWNPDHTHFNDPNTSKI